MSRKTISSAPSSSYRRASSTGSPASLMSTKRTPFTTRPLSTSKHGTMRFASIGSSGALAPRFNERRFVASRCCFVGREHRLADRELVLVEGPANDGAFDPVGAESCDGLQLLQGTDAPRCDDGQVGHLAQPHETFYIGSAQG